MIIFAHIDHINSLPKTIRKFTTVADHYKCDLDHGPWLAGGSVETLVRSINSPAPVDPFIRDFDMFFNTPNPPNNRKSYIQVSAGVDVTVDEVRYKGFNSLQDIFDDFDFTCSKWATDGKVIVADSQKTIDHTLNMILDIDKDEDRPNPFRLSRYLSKGYIPTPKVLRIKLADVKFNDNGLIDLSKNEY